MTEFEKALKIVEQINKLDLTETPVFTWDEKEKMQTQHDKTMWIIAVMYLIGGICIGFAIQSIFHIIK